MTQFTERWILRKVGHGPVTIYEPSCHSFSACYCVNLWTIAAAAAVAILSCLWSPSSCVDFRGGCSAFHERSRAFKATTLLCWRRNRRCYISNRKISCACCVLFVVQNIVFSLRKVGQTQWSLNGHFVTSFMPVYFLTHWSFFLIFVS